MNHIKTIIALLAFSISSASFCATEPASLKEQIEMALQTLQEAQANTRIQMEKLNQEIAKLETEIDKSKQAMAAPLKSAEYEEPTKYSSSRVTLITGAAAATGAVAGGLAVLLYMKRNQ